MSADVTAARASGPDRGLAAGVLLAGRYRVAARIATGGMGVVHQGWDERLSRPVALKLLHPHFAADPEVERRFRAEARHAARVKHPNVVVLLDIDDHGGLPFLVMELVTGTTMRNVLRERGRLPASQVLALLEPICAGLTAIHRTGLVHRDVKPENLLIDDTGRMRVADFGIASALDATRHTPAGVLLGSVRYLAPELVLGRAATPASDQYALGIVLFEAVTGTSPLPADDPAAVALRHAREAVPAPSTVDPVVGTAFDEVVTTATALAPEDRYPTLDALVAAARATVHASAARAGPFQPPLRGPQPPSRNWRTRPAARGQRLAADPPRSRSAAPPTPPPALAPPARTPRSVGADERVAGRHPTAVYPREPQRRGPTAAPPARMQRTPAPRVRRRRVSVLAVIAFVLALAEGVTGVFVAPLCATIALRRIRRRDGAPRGAILAYVALGIAVLRVVGWLATRS